MSLNWFKRIDKFGDGFKSNEVYFVSIYFALSQEMADKKQLLFEDVNGKIALQQVIQNQGSFEL